MLIDTINEILGMPLEKELRDKKFNYICSLDEKILGSYDLITTSYGPTKLLPMFTSLLMIGSMPVI